MRAAATLAALALALATPGTARAGDPPDGWEVPPPRDAKPVKAIDRCGNDETCFMRQSILDVAPVDRPYRVDLADFASLPVVRALTSPKDDAALKDVPPVRAIDDKGRPYPWPDGAEAIRLMPPGPLGELAWGEWGRPFFEDPAFRSMGYGELHSVAAGSSGKSIEGKVSYFSIGVEGAGPNLVFDRVVGKLDGTPRVVASEWEHATVVPLPGGLGHAARHEGDTGAVTLLLPEVLLGGESRNVAVTGGFFPGSRFSSNVAFTRYVMPATPGASATTVFRVLDHERNRWPKAVQPKDKPPRLVVVVVSTSQTSVEKVPTLVILTRELPSEF